MGKINWNRPYGKANSARGTGFVHSFTQDGKKYDVHGDECAPSYSRERLSVCLMDPCANHPREPDKRHRELIEAMKAVIRRDPTELPRIWVMPAIVSINGYKVVDGYKRYHAFKELGYERIECDVLDGGKRIL